MVGFTLHERQGTEHNDDDAGDNSHDRHMPRHHIGGDHGSYDCHHEGAGGDEQIVFRIGDKEHDQRTEFGRELEQRMRLGFVH
jgi:hypothetical protein